jgi:hypothetical protein
MAATMLAFFIAERNIPKKPQQLKYYMMKGKLRNSWKKIMKQSLHV